jgi:hypothetical protein
VSSGPAGNEAATVTMPPADIAATEDRDFVDITPEPPQAARPKRITLPKIDPRRATDAGVVAFYLMIGCWTTGGLWPHPATRAIGTNPTDQALIEWFLAQGTLVWSGDFSFVTNRLNSPDGVNLMANASHLLHGVLMAPITLAFGAPVSFAILLTGNLVATATGWYLLFSRTLRAAAPAAVIGGFLCGFAPGMMAQSNAHLHITAQWLVPPLVWCFITLARSAGDHHPAAHKQVLRTSLTLGVLIALQLFLGEEVLLLTVVTLAVFAICYAILRPRQARAIAPQFIAGGLIAAGLATVLLAYPLWVQFNGRMSVPNGPFSPRFFYADLASYFKFSPTSLAGSNADPHYNGGPGEYNTFFGLPLMLVLFAATIWLSLDRTRRPIAIASMVTALLWGWLSLGPVVVINGKPTGHKGPYHWLEGKPIIDGALPTRFALAMIPLFALILVLAVDKALRSNDIWGGAIPVVIIAALIPIAPTPLPIVDRPPVPTFISGGYWRTCVRPGGVLVPVPLPAMAAPDTMRWAAAANDAFALPEGRFIAPYAAGGRASLGIYPRPTSLLLADIDRTGVLPRIGQQQIAQARRDLAYWRAQCVALDHKPHSPQLKVALEQLLGPGEFVADTWIWRVS